MKLDNMLFKKIGPFPVALYLLVAIFGGWLWYRRHKQSVAAGGGSTGKDPNGLTSDVGNGSISSPDAGSFTGSNSLTVNGDTATQTASGPLLTGGFVGQPGGYQYAANSGDVYVNVPTPSQVTNVITSRNHHKDDRPHSPSRGSHGKGRGGKNHGNNHGHGDDDDD